MSNRQAFYLQHRGKINFEEEKEEKKERNLSLAVCAYILAIVGPKHKVTW
jgi:hypothetical protein